MMMTIKAMMMMMMMMMGQNKHGDRQLGVMPGQPADKKEQQKNVNDDDGDSDHDHNINDNLLSECQSEEGKLAPWRLSRER